MFVFRNYPYDRYADPKKKIYVGIRDFLAYTKEVEMFYEYQGRKYKRVATACIPPEYADIVSSVQEYEIIK